MFNGKQDVKHMSPVLSSHKEIICLRVDFSPVLHISVPSSLGNDSDMHHPLRNSKLCK